MSFLRHHQCTNLRTVTFLWLCVAVSSHLGSADESEPKWRDTTMYSVAVSPDGGWAVSAGFDTEIFLWEVASGRLKAVWPGRHKMVHALAFHPDGKQVAVGDYRGGLSLWEVASGQEVCILDGHPGDEFGNYELTCLAFSPDGRFLASGGNDQTVRLWDCAAGKQVCLWNLPANLRALVFSRDGKHVLFGGEQGMAGLFEVASTESRPALILIGPSQIVTTVAMSLDGRLALAASIDGKGYAWAADPNQAGEKRGGMGLAKPVKTFDLEMVPVQMATVPGSGLVLVAGSDDCLLWDLASNQKKVSFDLPLGGDLEGLAITADGKLFIAAQEKRLSVLDLETGNTLRTVFKEGQGQSRKDASQGWQLLQWAEEACHEGNYEQLVRGIKEALSENVYLDTWERAGLLFYLGVAYSGLEKEQEAARAFATSKETDPLFKPDRRQYPAPALAIYDAARP